MLATVVVVVRTENAVEKLRVAHNSSSMAQRALLAIQEMNAYTYDTKNCAELNWTVCAMLWICCFGYLEQMYTVEQRELKKKMKKKKVEENKRSCHDMR